MFKVDVFSVYGGFKKKNVIKGVSNNSRWETWVKRIGRLDIIEEDKDTSYYKVCADHFRRSTLAKKGLAIARKSLNINEVPSINLPIRVQHEGTQPEYVVKDGPDIVRKSQSDTATDAAKSKVQSNKNMDWNLKYTYAGNKNNVGPHYIIPKKTVTVIGKTQTCDALSRTSYSPLNNERFIKLQEQEYVITDSNHDHVIPIVPENSSNELLEYIEIPHREPSDHIIEATDDHEVEYLNIKECGQFLINETTEVQPNQTQPEFLDYNILKDVIMNTEPCFLDKTEPECLDDELVFRDSDIAELEKDLSTLTASANFSFFEQSESSVKKKMTKKKELRVKKKKRVPVDKKLSKNNLNSKRLSGEQNVVTEILLSDQKTQLADFADSVFMEDFCKVQEMLKETNQGHMFYKKFRLFCLNLYYKAPKAYKLFRNCFNLTPKRKLFETKINLGPGTNHNYIHLISEQLQDKPINAKYVTLCLDEILISKRVYYDILNDQIIGYKDVNGMKNLEEANTALVLRIKGCFVNYEQLIGYVLSGNTYDCPNVIEWINEILNLLFSIGFVVCAIVANQTPIISYLVTITPEKPFFMCGGNKIFIILDLPQLMNSVRNAMLTHDFLYDQSKLASWKYVKDFFNNQREKRISLAPKLTNQHVEPALAERTKDILTKQVFSYTVAAGVMADIESDLLSDGAEGTADFLLKINDLYDILSSTKRKNPYKNEKAFTGENYQKKCLREAYSTFSNIRAFNVHTGVEETELDCFVGLLITIKSVLELREYFTTLGIKSIHTRRLHLDTAKFISELTGQNNIGNSKLLTPIQFKRNFCRLALKKLLTSPKKVKEDDLDSMIMFPEGGCGKNDFSSLEEYLPKAKTSVPLAVGTLDYRTASTFENTSSYILYKCLTFHTCDDLKIYFSGNKRIVENVLNHDELESLEHTIIMVEIDLPQDFMDYMDRCEKCFVDCFNSFAFLKNVGTNLFEKLQELTPVRPCPCFPIEHLIKLFIRLRIYTTLKSRNKKLKMKAVK